jgi:predicted lactoylglutathione lyase
VALGFSFDSEHGDFETSASLISGEKNVVVMLFAEKVFRSLIGHDIIDPSKDSEVLLSLDAEIKQEVDEFLQKVKGAGGTLWPCCTKSYTCFRISGGLGVAIIYPRWSIRS